MDTQLRILRNSFFLSAQPLMMNIISLFVVGYIARKLGRADFGIFNLVSTITMLFFPVAMMGLNRITVRDMASIKEKGTYGRQMITTRLLTSLLAAGLIVFAANALGYGDRTIHAMYLGCAIFLFQVLSEISTDIFGSQERMEFTALVRMVAGLTLTALSVVVLYLGFGLFEVIGVYAFGQMVGCILAIFLVSKLFLRVKLDFSLAFVKEKIREGFPFFLMTLMWYAMMRLDTIFLSKRVEMAELGLYTSAIVLVTRLSIIPHGIANSLLPAISSLLSKGEEREITKITQPFLIRLVLLVLPGCIAVSVFSSDIITIIFGKEFHGGGVILRIGIWAFFIRCVAFVEFSILTAFHKERQMMWSYIFAIFYCFSANLTLIHYFQSLGAVSAFVSTQFVVLILFSFFAFRTIRLPLPLNLLSKIIGLNLIFASILYLLREENIFWVVPVGFVAYMASAVIMKIFSLKSFLQLKSIFVS